MTLDVTQSFDGDGATLKKVAANTVSTPGGNQTTTHTTYLVRSSVLGGKVVSEVGGDSDRSFVYLGGSVLAVQNRTSQTAMWQHRDAGDASVRMTTSNGTMGSEGNAELDPLGSDAGLSAPPTPSPSSYWKITVFPGFGNSINNLTCVLNGMPTPCSEVNRAIATGSADQCTDNNCDPRLVTNGKEWFVSPLIRDPNTGQLGHWDFKEKDDLPGRLSIYFNTSSDVHYIGMGIKVDSAEPQNPDREGIRNLVNETLAIDPCAQFAERILAAVSSSANPALGGGDLFSVFALFLNKGGQYTRTLPPGSAGWGNPIGLISSRGGAKIAMAPFPDPTLQTWSDAGTVIDELFHLAGTKAHYTDEQLAKAAHGIPEYAAQMSLSAGRNVFHPKYTGNPSNPKDGGYSSYFHNIARALCPVAKR